MALWGKPGAMIDGVYTLTTDDLTCNNKHNTLYVLSVQATVRLHEQVNGILETCTDMSVMKAGHALNKTMLLLKVHKGHSIRSYVHMAIQNIPVPYYYTSVPHFILLPFRENTNHSRKKSFVNELLWHSSRENIRDSAKFNCPYIGKYS